MMKKNLQININKAVKKLFNGDLLIFPTETVYGIGADATNNKAVNKIFKIKRRPTKNPIICHFWSMKQLNNYVILNKKAIKLGKKFWPGPLTIILEKKKNSLISKNVSNYKYIGCRIPNNKITINILKKFNKPVAAPSANISSKLSITNINQIDKIMKKNTFIINDGLSTLGLESTVISLKNNKPKLLRLGSLEIKKIKKLLPDLVIKSKKSKLILSPGQNFKHYSPNTPIRINIKTVKKNEVLLNFGKNKLKSSIKELNLSPNSNLKEAAKNFFKFLHILDNKNYKCIAVAPIPNNGLGLTINDRLKRAKKIK
ncbi:MAG: Threonylcarbamoyl-AMP synthase [Alphaproteobacteria bacterium MarineAlpha5_Bin9]|nr:MAG: Threonylcarbamoyl-AMP synthase [Alphaproteobacteria bacterium MarineAlpha5_Bin9]|tara:strand:- start:8973 stop:9914 length:942 start_codon:yes stop_codon:yes gene_type:complete